MTGRQLSTPILTKRTPDHERHSHPMPSHWRSLMPAPPPRLAGEEDLCIPATQGA